MKSLSNMKKTLEQKKKETPLTFRASDANMGEVAAFEQQEWQISRSGLKEER
jgi:hypothetical protein